MKRTSNSSDGIANALFDECVSSDMMCAGASVGASEWTGFQKAVSSECCHEHPTRREEAATVHRE